MIKTNQVLSVGWSLFTGIIWEKLRMNQQPSLRLYVKCAIQSENQHHPSAPFIFHAKKVKEALRTRLNGNKITWTETFVRSKIFTKWKTTLNRGTLACYENLPIKPTLKKNVQSFLRVTITPLLPRSVASGVYTIFPQITQKILITDTWTCHWLEPITVILGYCKYSLLEKPLISELWSSLKVKGSNQFSSPILDG